MKFPFLNPGNPSRDYVQEFRGYNHNLRIGDGEFYDETNLSSDNYPVITPRRKRTNTGVTATALIDKDGLYYVAGRTLYKYDGSESTELWNFASYEDITDPELAVYVPRHLVSMGAYIVIFPDKVYYNTVDADDKGAMGYFDEHSIGDRQSVEALFFNLCDADGTDLRTYTYTDDNSQNVTETIKISRTAPLPVGSPAKIPNGCLWLQIDDSDNVLAVKRYSQSLAQWTEISSIYTKISGKGIAGNIKEGDGVRLDLYVNDAQDSSQEYVEYNSFAKNNFFGKYVIVHKVVKQPEESTELDEIIVQGVVKVVEGNYNPGVTDTRGMLVIGNSPNHIYKLTSTNAVPQMDFVVESGNRLWGCRYGLNNDGKHVNEIYASKLGDFRNWNYYQGTAMDSYTASCGTDGNFTGAITYLGYPLFFKESHLHKVYGNIPANYNIQSVACRGVAKGAAGSLAIVGENLFYKSRSGVCVYDGTRPIEVSSPLGLTLYNAVDTDTESNKYPGVFYAGAVGGADDTKYYVSMKSEKDGAWNLFVFDTALNIWHREDGLRCDAFCHSGGKLYYIDHETRKIGFYGGEDRDIEWSATSGDLGLNSPDKKYVSKITLRMALDIGSSVAISIQYDNVGQYQHITTIHGSSLQSFTVPVRPRRCDHFRIKLDGRGPCKLYSISKSITQGSSK